MESSVQTAGPVPVAAPRGAARAGRTVPGLRWWIAGLLTCITVINYLDRSALAVVGPTLKTELAIDERSFAWIVIAFQASYGLSQPFAGRFLDWLNLRAGYAIALAWWSVAQALTGLATGWRSLAAMRAVLGVGEAGNFPGAIKTVSQWFPPKERTLATGIINIGSGVGSLLAPPVVVYLVLHFSWRAAFIATGAIGLLWVAVWTLLYRAPERHPLLSAAELAHIRQGGAEPQQAASSPGEGVAATVLQRRDFWALAIARFLSEPAWQLFTYWIPFYLVSERHLDLKQVALFAWMPFLAADLGCLFGGVLSPFFINRGFSVLAARKLAVTIPAALMTLAAFTGRAPSVELAIVLFSVGAFSHQAISSTLLTLPADLFPQRAVATANGLSGMAGYAGGMLFTWVVGRAASTVGYAPLFWAIGAFDLIGAAALWSLLREPKARAPEVAP